MKPFRSTLQVLLTLRQRAEQEALERYAQALLDRQTALESLAVIETEQSAWWARRLVELEQGCSGAFLGQWGAVDGRLRERRERAESALAQAELAVNQRLQLMLQARRDREAAEKYIQRQRALHDRELGREEQKAMDELSSRRTSVGLSWTLSPALPT